MIRKCGENMFLQPLDIPSFLVYNENSTIDNNYISNDIIIKRRVKEENKMFFDNYSQKRLCLRKR